MTFMSQTVTAEKCPACSETEKKTFIIIEYKMHVQTVTNV
jgi:hypothetical protein